MLLAVLVSELDAVYIQFLPGIKPKHDCDNPIAATGFTNRAYPCMCAEFLTIYRLPCLRFSVSWVSSRSRRCRLLLI